MHKRINTEQYLNCERYRCQLMRDIEREVCCLVWKIRALAESSFDLVESRTLENVALNFKNIADWLMLYSKDIEKGIIEIQVKRYNRDIKRIETQIKSQGKDINRKEKNNGRERN